MNIISTCSCIILSIISLIHISDAQIPPPIACNSTLYGSLSANESFAVFKFILLRHSYVEISTCGSDFDTYLALNNLTHSNDASIVASNDDDIDLNGCGINAVIDTDEISPGDYFIVVTASPYTSSLGRFGQYKIAVQCDPSGKPTIPDSNGIPVQSDCNFIQEMPIPQPLDICSIQIFPSTEMPTGFSRKYTCNSAKNGVIIMDYGNPDCSGDGSPSTLVGGGSTYYFNCHGSSDNCDIGSMEANCPNTVSISAAYIRDTVSFVLNICSNKRQIICDGGTLGMAEYSDDECVNVVNISHPPEKIEDNCILTSHCSAVVSNECSGGCDIGFECKNKQCVRNCQLFAVDDYLLECSDEFDRTGAAIDKLRNKIGKQQSNIDELKNKIENQQNKIESQENKIGNHQIKIDNLKQELITVNNRITAFGELGSASARYVRRKRSDAVPFMTLPQAMAMLIVLLAIVLFICLIVLCRCNYLSWNKNKTRNGYKNVKFVDSEEFDSEAEPINIK